MPVIFEKHISPAKKLAVWEITEPLQYFVDKLLIFKDPNRNEKRQLEQAAAKELLNYLSGKTLHSQLDKDVYGKPFIHDSGIQVSFSHSKTMVACLVDLKGGPVGIDIEYARKNIGVLAEKFVSEQDKTPYSGDKNHQLIWGAKEVLYKIYGSKGLDFILDLLIDFDSNLNGEIRKNSMSTQYQLDYTEIGEFMLVWNC